MNEQTPRTDEQHDAHEDAPAGPGRAVAAATALLFAFAASIFLHALFTYLSATTSFGIQTNDKTSETVEVQLAEIVTDKLEATREPELKIVEPEVEHIPEPEIAEEVIADVPVPESALASFDVSDLGELGSAGDAASQIGSSAISKASASFFGVEARGSRFVYIIDTSGSMANNRLDALKIALTDSINALIEQARFAVVQYAAESRSLNGDSWWKGEPAGKSDALTSVGALSARGDTLPVPAIQIAFSFTPPPDAIYFMTDGRFSPDREKEMIASIRRLMRRTGIRPTIHTISFVDKDAERLLRRIARMTGGSYTHVPGLER